MRRTLWLVGLVAGCAGNAQLPDSATFARDRAVSTGDGILPPGRDGGGAAVLDGWPVGDNPKKVRVVYLVPADRQQNPAYTAALERAIKHVQLWFHGKLGGARTFSLPQPAVRVVQTNHPTSYYTAPKDPADPNSDFGIRAREDGFAAVGGALDDPNSGWLLVIDAERPCDHGEGGAGHATIISSLLLKRLANEPLPAACPGKTAPTPGACQAYGQLAWWVAFFGGARTAETCAAGGTCRKEILMEGAAAYPAVDLLPADRAALEASPLFGAHSVGAAALWPCP